MWNSSHCTVFLQAWAVIDFLCQPLAVGIIDYGPALGAQCRSGQRQRQKASQPTMAFSSSNMTSAMRTQD